MKGARRKISVVAALLLCGVLALVSASGGKPNAQSQAKSRYYRLAGMQKAAEGDYDMAHELYKRSYMLNPDDSQSAYYYAIGLMTLPADSMSYYENSLEIMRPYIDEYTGDYDEGRFYALTAGKLRKYNESNRVLTGLNALYPSKSEILVSLAENFTALGQTDKAVEYYNRFEQIEGASVPLAMRKITLLINAQDTVAALREADGLIKSNTSNPEFYILKGDIEAYIGRPDSALVFYKRAEEVAPQSGEAKMALAGYYHERGDSVAYDRKIYEALLCDDFDLDTKLELLAEYIQPLLTAKASTEHGDYLLQELRNQYPHEPRIQDFAARYSAAKGDWNDAAEEISYAIDQDPENETYREQLMTYYLFGKKYDEAYNAYNEAVNKIGALPSLQYLAVSALSMNDKEKEALAETDALIRNINPALGVGDTLVLESLPDLSRQDVAMLAGAYTIAGDIYYKLNDKENAFRAYENALIFDPDNASTLNNYAYFICESGGDLDRALAMSEKSLKDSPDSIVYADTLAWILFKKKEYKRALEVMEAVMESDSENASDKDSEQELNGDYFSHYGDILFMCGEPVKALENWEKALKIEPADKLLQKKVKHKTYFYE